MDPIIPNQDLLPVLIIDTQRARQPKIRPLNQLSTLRPCLSEAIRGRVVDAQRCGKEIASLISQQYQFDADLLDWPYSPVITKKQMRHPLHEKVWHVIDGADTVRIFFGFDYVAWPEGVSASHKSTFRVSGPSTNLFLYRFSCGIVARTNNTDPEDFIESMFIFNQPGLYVPAHTTASLERRLLRYQHWNHGMSPKTFIEDIFADVVGRMEISVNRARTEMQELEDEVLLSPTSSEHPRRILRIQSVWKLYQAELVAILETISQINKIFLRFSKGSSWLAQEEVDVEKLKEQVDVNLIKGATELLALAQSAASLEAARAAVEKGMTLKRISVVTFIFFPLIFIASIFGMNVDTFSENPSIK
ncbi:hypothetical protein K402DRAFT_466198 [Aulographum hederae CBS 113979]|uniref:Uncharacterized protein n=1 Tax=Aulographum hederae CBS 113979 TaxID=1176131 RepID=A0A6G1GQB9_9PEZI|nr:hypothetical protein K402DRAFT_466198 [Aulographum hederae CBS 113979]